VKATVAPVLQGAQLQTNVPVATELTHKVSAVQYTQPTVDAVGTMPSPYKATPATTPSPSSPEVIHEDVARQAMYAGFVAMQDNVPIVVVPTVNTPIEGDRTATDREATPRVGTNSFKLTRTSQGVVMSTEGVVVPPGAVPVPFVPTNAGAMLFSFSPRVIANSMITLRVQPRFAGLIANILAHLRGGKEQGRTHTKHQLPAPLAHTIKPDAAHDKDPVERPNKSKESDEDGEERGQRDQDEGQSDDGQPDDTQDDDVFVVLPDFSHITFTR
jgi:hypothetical protein